LLRHLLAEINRVSIVQGAVLVDQSHKLEKSLAEADHLSGDPIGSRIRVLVVDDNEPFRGFVRATLSTRPELRIISEVSDGFEAVQKAQELQPGLIVLDIGLPGLNGLEAARRIRKLSPSSAVLFLSQESSPEIVHEAFCLGALGFVIKTHAASDLLLAVDAVLRKEQFVSSTLKTVDGQR
jgi:DNA-binding NarL/FixJ family response regulator